MKILENMKLEDMRWLLMHVREYADMTQKLGLRGRKLFSHKLLWKKEYVVEYFPNLWEDTAWSQAEQVFKKSFSETPSREDVIFIAHNDLKGGMKVYVDDNMVDVSFKKVENLLKK